MKLKILQKCHFYLKSYNLVYIDGQFVYQKTVQICVLHFGMEGVYSPRTYFISSPGKTKFEEKK
jgi:hypothetical protein